MVKFFFDLSNRFVDIAFLMLKNGKKRLKKAYFKIFLSVQLRVKHICLVGDNQESLYFQNMQTKLATFCPILKKTEKFVQFWTFF